MSLPAPKVVVGLDFGTTFSGFAFAHTADPDSVYNFSEYPKGSGCEKFYCKTLTGSYYKQTTDGVWQFKSWGYPARAEYASDVQALQRFRASGARGDPLQQGCYFGQADGRATQCDNHAFQPSVGTYLTRFKLHLAMSNMGTSSAKPLLPGLTVSMVITDYLRAMGTLVLGVLQTHYGPDMTMQAIKWCLTVPSIWNNAAKAVMRKCVADAGLLDGSPHPLVMVLEPEAASFSCHKSMNEQALEVGDKLVVADIGGGTADIVVQEVVSVESSGHYRVREATISSGGLCGGTHVDSRFMSFLHDKIGPCLEECIKQNLSMYGLLLQEWEQRKTNFGDPSLRYQPVDFNLPSRLVSAWDNWDTRMGIMPPRDSYDEFEISYQAIFDPVVDQNVKLIKQQLDQAGAMVKVLVVVGGFAGSFYLMQRIRSEFGGRVPEIISPPNPGSAVSRGAVMLALNPRHMLSRVSKKTYGIEFSPSFDEALDASKYKMKVDGRARCSKRFEIFVRKGDKVDVASCMSRKFSPLCRDQKTITFQLFSSTEPDPRYTDEPGARKEGEIEIDISLDMALDRARQVQVSLYFGGSTMEIKAEAVNCVAARLSESLKLPVAIDFV